MIGAMNKIVRQFHTGRYKFVDRVRVQVTGGRGGKGLLGFESLTNIKKRPTGGNGGRGGDIIIEATQTVRDLNFQTFHIRGRDGTDAAGRGNNGRGGKLKKIMVPVGTVVKEIQRTYLLDEAFGNEDDYDYQPADVAEANDTEESEESSDGSDSEEHETQGGRRGNARNRLSKSQHKVDDSEEDASEDEVPSDEDKVHTTRTGVPFRERIAVLCDLDVHGQSLLAARGGAPGTGNKGSILTYAEQVHGAQKPHIQGGAGETRYLELELKLIADVGLVGFPNAGKSSFVGAISKAKPKVADYPFTTLHPTVGVVAFRDNSTITVADIPGIIEGAHADRGLGHEFLRHIERTKIIAYLLDVANAADPFLDLRTLQNELRLYDPTLVQKPSIIIANKIDLPGAREKLERLRRGTSLPVIEVSALHKQHLDNAVNSLRWLVDLASK